MVRDMMAALIGPTSAVQSQCLLVSRPIVVILVGMMVVIRVANVLEFVLQGASRHLLSVSTAQLAAPVMVTIVRGHILLIVHEELITAIATAVVIKHHIV